MLTHEEAADLRAAEKALDGSLGGSLPEGYLASAANLAARQEMYLYNWSRQVREPKLVQAYRKARIECSNLQIRLSISARLAKADDRGRIDRDPSD